MIKDMDKYFVSYIIGITLVFLSHVYMLYSPETFMDADKMKKHAWVNLIAGCMIAYGYLHLYL